MESFNSHCGIVAPFDRANIDTDAIIPKQFLKSVKKSGFGPNLFDEWRYLDHGEPGMDNSKRQINPDFVLNQPQYQYSSVLLARDNFGCGSSREHAPWALFDFGFRVIISSSYADIFYNNCFKNGILPIILETGIIDRLFKAVLEQPGYKISVNLEQQQIDLADNSSLNFDIDPARKQSLLNGLDEIGETLESSDQIKTFETNRKQTHPWLFNSLSD